MSNADRTLGPKETTGASSALDRMLVLWGKCHSVACGMHIKLQSLLAVTPLARPRASAMHHALNTASRYDNPCIELGDLVNWTAPVQNLCLEPSERVGRDS